MKTHQKSFLSLFVLLLVSFQLMTSCQQEQALTPEGDLKSNASTLNNNDLDCSCIVNPSPEINQQEIDMLLYMREEEKLARDVYTAFSLQYPLPVFTNISKSEQWHMDRVLCLLNHYEIADPASAETGVFTNPDLQTLYNNLTEQGSVSLAAALTAGATIEDLDIADLEDRLALTENEAIITIFQHLRCGSTNHMRAFNALLSKNGVVYTPQFISQEEFDAIIESPHQRCGTQTGLGTGSNCVKNPGELSDTDVEMLVFMREEEKMARDVYTVLSGMYNMPIFVNISKSEQVHMDKILCILDFYGIEDPASEEIGVFNNPDLQELYDNLIALGSQSLNDALTAGATIEDVDIVDLENNMLETDDTDILRVFESLSCGSGNHLRSFTTILTKRGITYTPQYLTQEAFDAIVGSDYEFCGN